MDIGLWYFLDNGGDCFLCFLPFRCGCEFVVVSIFKYFSDVRDN